MIAAQQVLAAASSYSPRWDSDRAEVDERLEVGRRRSPAAAARSCADVRSRDRGVEPAEPVVEDAALDRTAGPGRRRSTSGSAASSRRERAVEVAAVADLERQADRHARRASDGSPRPRASSRGPLQRRHGPRRGRRARARRARRPTTARPRRCRRAASRRARPCATSSARCGSTSTSATRSSTEIDTAPIDVEGRPVYHRHVAGIMPVVTAPHAGGGSCREQRESGRRPPRAARAAGAGVRPPPDRAGGRRQRAQLVLRATRQSVVVDVGTTTRRSSGRVARDREGSPSGRRRPSATAPAPAGGLARVDIPGVEPVVDPRRAAVERRARCRRCSTGSATPAPSPSPTTSCSAARACAAARSAPRRTSPAG